MRQNSAMTLNQIRGLAVKSACLYWLILSPATVLAQQNILYSTLDDFIRAQTQGLPGKVAYTISQLDTRTQLTPCNAFEPFIPQGGKLWGKTTVGVRCLGPSNWTIYVPVQVSVTGDYLVAARNFQVGTNLAAADIAVRNGDLSTLPASILTDPAQAIGKTVKNGVGSGQPLRSDQLIAPWAVQQGQSVKTVSNGPGFSVSSDGKALNNATAGQIVQVRTASGQTVSGIARAGGVVEVSN
jgi:flagella basal body P-ring formation protein FlgA